MFSVGDIYKRIKPFKTRLASRPQQKFYFAKVDVQSAFDTIPQAAVVGLLDSVLRERQYRILKYMEVAPNVLARPQGKAGSRLKLTRRWPLAATKRRDPRALLGLLEESGRASNRRSTVFVDTFSKRDHGAGDLLRLVESHVRQNLVRIGKKFYRQREGIPQGSVLSSTLCSYFYADLELRVLPFLGGPESDDGDCLLLRLIDDFLLITTDRDKAARFVETMHRGVPAYGVAVNPRKTLVNFDLAIDGRPVPRHAPGQDFPYCGTRINCKTLDIARARQHQGVGDDVSSSKYLVRFPRPPQKPTPPPTPRRRVLLCFPLCFTLFCLLLRIFR